MQASVINSAEDQIRRRLTQALGLGAFLGGRGLGCYTLLQVLLHLNK